MKRENVLAIGDNYNDIEMLKEAGIAVSADKSRLKGDFYVDFDKKSLPAGVLMRKILSLV